MSGNQTLRTRVREFLVPTPQPTVKFDLAAYMSEVCEHLDPGWTFDPDDQSLPDALTLSGSGGRRLEVVALLEWDRQSYALAVVPQYGNDIANLNHGWQAARFSAARPAADAAAYLRENLLDGGAGYTHCYQQYQAEQERRQAVTAARRSVAERIAGVFGTVFGKDFSVRVSRVQGPLHEIAAVPVEYVPPGEQEPLEAVTFTQTMAAVDAPRFAQYLADFPREGD